MANFKRGRGDYMGIAESPNDGSALPAPVGSYWPNDYGIYNMAGNVSEWVSDVYRPLSFDDVADFSPYRGNIFTQKVMDGEFLAEKDSLGHIRRELVPQEEAAKRQNYRTAFNSNYGDGDYMSAIRYNWTAGDAGDQANYTKDMYDYATNETAGTTLINDESRVYKGGSWADGPYYLSPGTRRFLDQNHATSTIGFRCAMNKIGDSKK